MAAITWKNIPAPGNTGIYRGLTGANSAVSAGIGIFDKMITNATEGAAEREDAINVLAMKEALLGAKTPEEVAALEGKLGELTGNSSVAARERMLGLPAARLGQIRARKRDDMEFANEEETRAKQERKDFTSPLTQAMKGIQSMPGLSEAQKAEKIAAIDAAYSSNPLYDSAANDKDLRANSAALRTAADAKITASIGNAERVAKILTPPGGSGRGRGSGLDALTKGISDVFGTALTPDKDEMIRDSVLSLDDPTLIDYIPENALIRMIKRGKEAGDGWLTFDSSGTTQFKRDLEDWISNNSKVIAKAKERERDETATRRLVMQIRDNLLLNSSPEAAAAYKKAMAKAGNNANFNEPDPWAPLLKNLKAGNAAETDANMVGGTNLTGFTTEEANAQKILEERERQFNRDSENYNQF
jgi:hypothetical protein